MDEPVRWVTKAQAAEELAVSLSTLDRKIRQGEIEVRRVFVRMEGPEYPSDELLLLQSLDRERELQRTVRQLEQSVSEWEQRASELNFIRVAAFVLLALLIGCVLQWWFVLRQGQHGRPSAI